MEPQLPPAFFCQDSGGHPASEGWVGFPTLASLDPGDTNLRGVGREKRDTGGTGWVEVYGSRAKGEWPLAWFFCHTEDPPGGCGDSLAASSCSLQARSEEQQHQGGPGVYLGASRGNRLIRNRCGVHTRKPCGRPEGSASSEGYPPPLPLPHGALDSGP